MPKLLLIRIDFLTVWLHKVDARGKPVYHTCVATFEVTVS